MTADGSAFVANKEMSFDGTDFKTEGFLWYEDVDATSTLFAYYPYQAGAAAPAEFSVKADQSGANYTASDLIVAVKTGVKPTLSSTQMTFKHKMSRIVISVTNESGFDIRDIVIKGAVGTGVLDPATGDFTAKAGAEASDVTANTATAEKVYYALLVQQNGVQLKVTVTPSITTMLRSAKQPQHQYTSSSSPSSTQAKTSNIADHTGEAGGFFIRRHRVAAGGGDFP